MPTNTQRLVAEGFGTFALVLIGAGSVIANSYSGGSVGLVGIALAHGLTIMAMVYAFGPISGGHFNPAVTFAMLVIRKISAGWAGLYVLAQLIGASVAGAFLYFLMPVQSSLLHNGVPMLGQGISIGQGIGLELLITFILVTIILGTAVNPNTQSKHAGLAIGLTITLLILFAGAMTGAAINPARAFGPALSSWFWPNQIVYWVGPLGGGLLAALLYQDIFLKIRTKK